MTTPPDTPNLTRERPLIWYDAFLEQYQTGLVDVANLIVHEQFTDDEIDRAVAMATSEPGRELLVSMHRSANAAKQAAMSRKASDRWPRLKIAVRTLPKAEGMVRDVKYAALVIAV